eukprot:1959642-Amphidinium_carterae.1
MGFNKLKSEACVFGNVKTSIYIMSYVDDLLVVGNPKTVKTFLVQLDSPLEFKAKTIELQP